LGPSGHGTDTRRTPGQDTSRSIQGATLSTGLTSLHRALSHGPSAVQCSGAGITIAVAPITKSPSRQLTRPYYITSFLLLGGAVQCSAVQCSAVQCSAVQNAPPAICVRCRPVRPACCPLSPREHPPPSTRPPLPSIAFHCIATIAQHCLASQCIAHHCPAIYSTTSTRRQHAPPDHDGSRSRNRSLHCAASVNGHHGRIGRG
jgi:hypothetical protein